MSFASPPNQAPLLDGTFPSSTWATWFSNIASFLSGSFSTQDTQMQVGTTYISQSALITTYTLPLSFNVNDTVELVGFGAGGWTITQNAGQTIHSPSGSTTIGITGSLSSTNPYDSVVLKGVVKNTEMVITSQTGNLTIA